MLCTLLTDFGLSDSYVAQMKGVLYSSCPACTVVDVTHLIGPGDIQEGAHVLWQAVSAFPPGTVHIAVVDPTVGSSRHPLVVVFGDQLLVGPDNGLFTHFLTAGGQAHILRDLSPRTPWATFHGRDLFAPAAARLLTGTPLEELTAGPVPDPVLLRFSEVLITTAAITGCIRSIDRFGNGISDIPVELVQNMVVASTQIGDTVVEEIGPGPPMATFASVLPGRAALWLGSGGTVEIGVNAGNGSKVLGFSRGTRLILHRGART